MTPERKYRFPAATHIHVNWLKEGDIPANMILERALHHVINGDARLVWQLSGLGPECSVK